MARGAATAKVKEVQKGVGGTWDKLEQVFEDRVERALSKLGVYTQNDVERLTERVDALAEAVNELVKSTGVKPAVGRKGAAATKRRKAKGAAPKARTTARATRKYPTPYVARPAGFRRAFSLMALCSVAIELVDLFHVVRHRVVLAAPFQLGPRVVLGAADEIEAPRTGSLDVALGRLLVVRVQLEQRCVVGLLLGLFCRCRGCLELRLQIILLRRGGHGVRPPCILI
jgi:hypothetical protein